MSLCICEHFSPFKMKYISHEFCFYEEDENEKDRKGFLWLGPDGGKGYQCSAIIFPMAIHKLNLEKNENQPTIVITAGFMDCHTSLHKMPINWVKNSMKKIEYTGN